MEPDLSQLMRRAQEGDARAYESLLLRLAPLVRSFARTRLAGADFIEDVVQETLLSVHRDRHTWDASRPLLPWFYAIARHRLLDVVARQRRWRRKEVGEEASVQEPASDPGPVEAIRGLRRALALLSGKQREIIQLLKFEGLSVVEIARQTGLSESAVKVTAHRGYNKLRELMVGFHDD